MSNPPEKIRRFPALFRQNPRARAAIMRTYISKRKGDGGMRYSLYIDRIFVTHLTVNLCLLFLTAKSGGMDCRKGRIFRAAAAGAAMMTAALALPVPVQERELRLILKGIWLAAGVFAQLWIAFRCRNGKMLGRAVMLYGACSCMTGGILGAVMQIKKLSGSWAVSLLCIGAAYAGFLVIVSERRRSRSPLWKVSFCRNGDIFSETGLLDSGNGLYDPYTKMPVCIIDPAEAERLGIFEKDAPLRLIPYHCVGKRNGLMRAVTVDGMYLEKEGQEKRVGQVTLAVSPEPLAASGAYRVILHPALLEEKKGANHDLKSSDAGKHAV